MAIVLSVGDVVDCVVRKVQANGLSVSLPNGRFGYVPKYCAQSLCDADGDFVVKEGDAVSLTIQEIGQPIRLGDGEASAPAPAPAPAQRVSVAASGPKVVGKIDLVQVRTRRRVTPAEESPVPEYKVGEVLEGTVSRVQDNGAYIMLRRGGQGFIPSYLMDKDSYGQPRRYRRGERVVVGVASTKGYIRLCGEDKFRKRERYEEFKPIISTALRYFPMMAFLAEHKLGDLFLATVADVSDDKIIISLPNTKTEGLVWRDEASWKRVDSAMDVFAPGDTVDAVLIGHDMAHYRLLFSIRQATPRPDDAWEMSDEEKQRMHDADTDSLSAAATYKVGDVVRATLTHERDYYLYFTMAGNGIQGYAFKEMFPQLLDSSGRLMAKPGKDVQAVVVQVGGRIGLCDERIWQTRRDEVDAVFLTEFAQQPIMKTVAAKIYRHGAEAIGTVTDLDGDRVVVALSKGGLGFMKKSEMLVAPEGDDKLKLGDKISATVVRSSKQGFELCDSARHALQKLRLGSPLSDVYHVGDFIHGVVARSEGETALVTLPHGGNGVLQLSHISPGIDGSEPAMPSEGQEIDAVIINVGRQRITLCDMEKWKAHQERNAKRPEDYFNVGDKLTAKVLYATKAGVYVQIPTAGKGFWPVYNMLGYVEGKSKPMPRRGATVTTIVQKVTDKGVILCDETYYAQLQEEKETNSPAQ